MTVCCCIESDRNRLNELSLLGFSPNVTISDLGLGEGAGIEGERVEIEGGRGGGIDSILSSEKPGVPDGDRDGQ